MLAHSKLPTTFWAEAVNTACYVQNRVLVTKPHNKTPYELFLGRKPALGFMRPFRCPITILNTIDHLGKFDGSRLNWIFDIDALTKSMNYKPVVAENQFNSNAGTKACDDACKARMETLPGKDYILLPLWTADPPFSQSSKSSQGDGSKPSSDDEKKVDEDPRKDSENDPNMPALEDIVYTDDEEYVSAEADMNNLDAFMANSSIPTTRVHKDHPVEQIIRDLNSAPQTRRMTKNLERIEAIRLFLAYASFKDFVVYQMDVKSAFLYGKIKEEVYVCQPPGFEDPDFPDRVYKVEKALYELHQALRAWYETLSTYLLDNRFQREKIDKTLFIRRDKGDILLVQVQDKYMAKILKKFGFTDVKTASTPMETQKALLKDEDGEEVDVYLYRSMIGSLMYLTSSRPDIMFAIYLKGQPKLGLWYPKDSPFDLVAYTDSDYAGANLDRKSTIGVNEEQQLQALVDGKKIIITEATVRKDLQLEDADGMDYLPNAIIFEQLTLMGSKTTAWNEFSSTMASAIICLATNQKFNFCKYIFEIMVKNLDNTGKFLMYPRKQKSRRPKEKDTEIPQSSVPGDPTNIADEAVNEEPNMQLKELMDFCTKLQQRVIDLENTKIDQAHEITHLKKRVKKLEKKRGSRIHKLKRLYRVGRKIHDIDADEDITLENVHDAKMFNVNELDGDEVVVESEVADKDVNLSVDEVTLAQALTALKSAKVQEKRDVTKESSVPVSTASTKVSIVIPTTVATTITVVSSRPRAKWIVFHEEEQEQDQAPTLIVSLQQTTQVKDKGKGKRVEEEPVKKISKKELLKLDEELAFKLQAKEDEEERLAREKAQKVKEANIDWDDIQDKVEVDYKLAQRLQALDQEELSDAEKATLFVQLLEKRRKHFTAKRAEEKRNRPPTKAQQRSFMCTYLKNIEGWKPKDLKNKSFANIQDLFNKAMKRVNTFVDMDTELVKESFKKAEAEIAQESSSKRAREALEQERSKKQKVDDDKETEELKQCMEIISDDRDDVTIEATPLSTKSLTIMLKNFDREDLEVLWSIVKVRFKKTEPVNYMDTFLHLNLKTMFEHHLEDNVWKNQQGLVKVLNWKLYDYCGVHCVTMQTEKLFLFNYPLVEKICADMDRVIPALMDVSEIITNPFINNKVVSVTTYWPDVVDQVFEMKIGEFIKLLKEEMSFGDSISGKRDSVSTGNRHDFYPTFHKTPNRKKFSEEEWDNFIEKSARHVVTQLAL
ncbi:retrovirus-related pol polyprotein from transposon TNT 1-94 [Tanacetum coccineum]